MPVFASSAVARTAAVAAVALALACGGSDESASVDTRDAAAKAGTGRASSAGAPGRERRAAEPPAELPADVPIYSPSTAGEVLAGSDKYATSFTTEANSREVAAFYRQRLPEQGWKLEEEVELGDHVMLRGSKSGRKVSVFIMTREGLTTVAVTVARG